MCDSENTAINLRINANQLKLKLVIKKLGDFCEKRFINIISINFILQNASSAFELLCVEQ
jgi:hypothetical protein